MTAQHTPGPWKISGDDVIAVAGSTGFSAGANPAIAFIYETLDQSRAINARLIAAAPELLAACNVAEELIDDLIRAPKVKHNRKQILAKLRAAIAKAKGEAA